MGANVSDSASRQDVERLLMDKLSDALSDTQKRNKIQNLLASRSRRDGSIVRSWPKQKAVWGLAGSVAASPSKITGQQ
jgi:ATP-dependent DNA helicase RecG